MRSFVLCSLWRPFSEDLLKRREQANPRAAFLRGWSSTDVTLGDFLPGRVLVSVAYRQLPLDQQASMTDATVVRFVPRVGHGCTMPLDRITGYGSDWRNRLIATAVEAVRMSKNARKSPAKPKRPKTKLGLPDLDHSRSAVLDSLRSHESKRGYRHAIDEFIQWYCSERRLSFSNVVVTRYRIFLENRKLAAGTINGRLAAVRRLAYEAADAGLLSPELAAGVRRVKGIRKLGVRLGNWLTAEEARLFLQSPPADTLKGKRDRAILAVLLGCGLRRRELADLQFKNAPRAALSPRRSCRVPRESCYCYQKSGWPVNQTRLLQLRTS